ncbi:MAG: hypothetical protein CMB25_03515 [Euryarchaeota archaeon]|nr:hypothetical protein [Euryarchaeota archaeon]|tara:strand:+ start:4179 stop:5228 length:1050 start_codon:yes stop_codon:yes gene_type:complete
MRPKAPGLYISKWREDGPVPLEEAQQWREEFGWSDWMAIIEAALYLDAAELVELLRPELTAAQQATFDLVRRRMLGDHRLEDAIDKALDVCRAPETRDLALEGRLRMERGLQRFEKGDSAGAEEDLTWAETRLKSVAKASRDHDLSLLNKAAYHMAVGEDLMSLQVYGDISRHDNHAHETIAISRIGASRIHARYGRMFDAARNAWNGHAHAILANQVTMAIEAGSLFLDLSIGEQDESAIRFQKQVDDSKPRDAGERAPELNIHPDDVSGVFEWCMNHLHNEPTGQDRPDLRAMVMMAHRLDRINEFDWLLEKPELVEDSMLVAVVLGCSLTDQQNVAWTERMQSLMP